MRRLIRTRISAALGLSQISHRLNEGVIQTELEQELDGICQLCADFVTVSNQLPEDPSRVEKLGQIISRLDALLQGCQLETHGLAPWQRMHRSAKVDGLKALIREAKSLLMAHAALPVHPERRRTPASRSAHPPAAPPEVSAG